MTMMSIVSSNKLDPVLFLGAGALACFGGRARFIKDMGAGIFLPATLAAAGSLPFATFGKVVGIGMAMLVSKLISQTTSMPLPPTRSYLPVIGGATLVVLFRKAILLENSVEKAKVVVKKLRKDLSDKEAELNNPSTQLGIVRGELADTKQLLQEAEDRAFGLEQGQESLKEQLGDSEKLQKNLQNELEAAQGQIKDLKRQLDAPPPPTPPRSPN